MVLPVPLALTEHKVRLVLPALLVRKAPLAPLAPTELRARLVLPDPPAHRVPLAPKDRQVLEPTRPR